MKRIVIYGIVAMVAAAALALLASRRDPTTRCAQANPLLVGERWDMLASQATAGDDFAGGCLGEGRPDLVRRLVVERRGRLTVKAEGPEPNLSMALLPEDCAAAPVACGAGPGAIDLDVAAGVYHLVVDGPANGSAVTVDVRSGLRLEELSALRGRLPVKPTVPLGGGCLNPDIPSAAWRLNHPGGALRIELRGGVNPGALAVRRKCEAQTAAGACVEGEAPTLELPELDKGAWCVVAQGDGARTIERVPIGDARSTAELAIGATLHLRPTVPAVAAGGATCAQAGPASLIGRFELNAPAQVRATVQGAQGTLSVVGATGPICGATIPPELVTVLPAGAHELRIEGASEPSYSVVVTASPPPPTPGPPPSDAPP